MVFVCIWNLYGFKWQPQKKGYKKRIRQLQNKFLKVFVLLILFELLLETLILFLTAVLTFFRYSFQNNYLGHNEDTNTLIINFYLQQYFYMIK